MVYETSDEYLESLVELSKTVEDVENAILIVKFRSSPEIGIEEIRSIVPFSEKVILSIEESFLSVLAMADLLVSFSSTTIEEALQNRVPVLLYGGGGRYVHVPAYEIREGAPPERAAVYHAMGPRELSCAVGGILDLRIDGSGADSVLFDKFIYPESERITLENLLNDVK